MVSSLAEKMDLVRKTQTSVLSSIWMGICDVPGFLKEVVWPTPGPGNLQWLTENDDIPHSMCCNINLGALMVDPVVVSGMFYERTAIESWITAHATDPFTRAPLVLEDISPCSKMKEIIYEYAKLRCYKLASLE